MAQSKGNSKFDCNITEDRSLCIAIRRSMTYSIFLLVNYLCFMQFNWELIALLIAPAALPPLHILFITRVAMFRF